MAPGRRAVILPAWQRAALEMAAAGCVSGRLSEWPILAAAFHALGVEARLSMGAPEMRARAQAALGRLAGLKRNL